MSQATCTVAGITKDGKHGRAGVTRSVIAAVAAEQLSLLLRPNANDIRADRVILRQPDTQGENPGIAAFAQHHRQFFSARDE
jgi:hypothetical protein